MARAVIHTSGRRTGLVIGPTGEGVIVRGPRNWGERLIAIAFLLKHIKKCVFSLIRKRCPTEEGTESSVCVCT